MSIGTYLRSAQEAVQMDEQEYVVNQLAGLGLTPRDIHYVICTHFDADHAGNHDVFPDATFVVQRSHYEIAHQRILERLNQASSSWDVLGLHYRLVDGDLELLPGIELLETSGHVPGHQSVLVRLPQTGPVLLAIDAIPMSKYLDIVLIPTLSESACLSNFHETAATSQTALPRKVISLALLVSRLTFS